MAVGRFCRFETCLRVAPVRTRKPGTTLNPKTFKRTYVRVYDVYSFLSNEDTLFPLTNIGSGASGGKVSSRPFEIVSPGPCYCRAAVPDPEHYVYTYGIVSKVKNRYFHRCKRHFAPERFLKSKRTSLRRTSHYTRLLFVTL